MDEKSGSGVIVAELVNQSTHQPQSMQDEDVSQPHHFKMVKGNFNFFFFEILLVWICECTVYGYIALYWWMKKKAVSLFSMWQVCNYTPYFCQKNWFLCLIMSWLYDVLVNLSTVFLAMFEMWSSENTQKKMEFLIAKVNACLFSNVQSQSYMWFQFPSTIQKK